MDVVFVNSALVHRAAAELRAAARRGARSEPASLVAAEVTCSLDAHARIKPGTLRIAVDEMPARLSAFVHDRLPNLAKQIGATGAGKRTDLGDGREAPLPGHAREPRRHVQPR